MILKNKKTGEPGKLVFNNAFDLGANTAFVIANIDGDKMGNRILGEYSSLAELNEEWEDASEEPKNFWCIDYEGNVGLEDEKYEEHLDEIKQIGNYFNTSEEAEKAVEKLKAYKRLKDKGFEFGPVNRYEALCGNGFNIPITATMPPEAYTDAEVSKDLDICFGVEK